MNKKRLASVATSLVISSSALGAELSLLSNLEIEGDARVRGISTSGITSNSDKAKETYDSRIRINLNTTTDSGVKIHSRVVLDNDTWGKTSDKNVEWDEASVLVPLKDFFVYAGRVNDTYGTPFYGSHNDKIDLAFIGYTGIENTLLYGFDYKAVEGAYNSSNGQLGSSTGDGDYDAYGLGGQITIDKLLLGGRYVSLQDNRSDDGGKTFRDTKGFFVDAFASGEIAGLELQAQIQQNGGDKYSGGKKVDLEALGMYLNVAKQFDRLKIGAIAISTEDGYVAGGDLEASYLTSPTNGAIATLGRVGGYGDTVLLSGQIKYDINPELLVEATIASHSIKKATLNSLNKDLEITEYNIGLQYKIAKDVTYKIQYAAASFDQGNLDDIQNAMHSINIKF